MGIIEWIHYEDFDHARRLIEEIDRLHIPYVRIGFTWADWHEEHGDAWFKWLFEVLSAKADVLPCFVYTPVHEAHKKFDREANDYVPYAPYFPPKHPDHYVKFIDTMISRYGSFFTHLELWNEPNNKANWDRSFDPEWHMFGDMLRRASRLAQYRGKKVVLGGLSPIDPRFLDVLHTRGALDGIDVVGIHAFPQMTGWTTDWQGWDKNIAAVKQTLNNYGLDLPVWITEVGHSTFKNTVEEEEMQVTVFNEVLAAKAERVYWYCMFDLAREFNPTQDDEREYHLGIKHADGKPKLLYSKWLTQSQDTEQLIDK